MTEPSIVRPDLHVPADSVILHYNRDVESGETVLGTDTGEKKDLGRVGGTSGEDDLLGHVQVVRRGWKMMSDVWRIPR